MTRERVYDVRPLRFTATTDEHTVGDEVRLRISEAVTGLIAHADQEHGEVDWGTLTMTIERHSHDGQCVLRSSARLRRR
jgi:hypothetical protein